MLSPTFHEGIRCESVVDCDIPTAAPVFSNQFFFYTFRQTFELNSGNRSIVITCMLTNIFSICNFLSVFSQISMVSAYNYFEHRQLL